VKIRAIVPAWNEEATVADTVQPLVESGMFDMVLVVDDGSTDRTAAATCAQGACEIGAAVLTLTPNRGKGGAMLEAVTRALADGCEAIAFFDADLRGLRAEHARWLVDPVADGRCVMCCGLRDYGPLINEMARGWPPITGERCVRADVLRAVPPAMWDGYKIEVGLNETARTIGETYLVVLDGLQIVGKTEKFGRHEGFVRLARMSREVLIAWRDVREELKRG